MESRYRTAPTIWLTATKGFQLNYIPGLCLPFKETMTFILQLIHYTHPFIDIRLTINHSLHVVGIESNLDIEAEAVVTVS